MAKKAKAKAKPAPKAKAKAKPAPKAAAKAAPKGKPAAEKKSAGGGKAAAASKSAAGSKGGAAAKAPDKVKAIPPGFHAITPHLVVRNSAQAIDFYKHAFGAVEKSRMPGPDGFSIAHADIQIGDSHLFLCDENVNMGIQAPPSLNGTPATIHLYVDDADAVFNQAVSSGATVKMPLMDMFWGDRYGKLLDPFGHEWSIATHKEDLSFEEMGKRAEAAFAKMAK